MTENGRGGDREERLRALQRRAFAADGDAAGDAAVARDMAQLRAEIAAERAAGAPGEELSTTEPTGPLPAAVGTSADPGTLVASGAGESGAAATTDAGGRRSHRLVLAASLAAALAVGGVLGGTVTAVNRPVPPPSTDAAPAGSEPVLASTVFTRLQTPKDIPLVAMPDAFVAASFRYLGSAGWTDADEDGVTDSPYYAAQTTSDMICLVVVPAGSGYLSTCAPESAYPPAGLRLSWQSTDLHPGVPGGTPGMVLDVSVAWLSDSTVETRGAGRPMPGP